MNRDELEETSRVTALGSRVAVHSCANVCRYRNSSQYDRSAKSYRAWRRFLSAGSVPMLDASVAHSEMFFMTTLALVVRLIPRLAAAAPITDDLRVPLSS